MKRKVLVFLMVLTMVVSLTACSGAVKEEPVAEESAMEESVAEEPAMEEPAAPETVYTMKIGHAHSTEAIRHLGLLEFEKLVEEATNGGVDVEIYPNNELGTEEEMIEAVKLGVIQSTLSGKFDLVSPDFSIYLMPFLFDGPDDFQKIAGGELGDRIAARSTEVGITVLATGDAGGFRQWTNNIRPIATPEDMKGLKMRTPGVQAIQDEMGAFGANVTAIPYAELYEALKTGVVDGQENPYANIVDKKFYEVQKYMTVCNYQIHPAPLCVNTGWLSALPAEYQAALTDAANAMFDITDQMFVDKSAEHRGIIEDAGVEVYELTADEKAAFKALGQSVIDDWTANERFDVDLFNDIAAELE